jgi:hypothetical protein
VETQVVLFMVGEAARLMIAAVLALAAYHAMREWAVFGGIVEQYHLAPRRLAQLAARILPPLELVAAVLLVVPVAGRAGAALGLGLMALFTTAITINLARGRVSIDCGCGGATGQKLSIGLVVRNLLIMLGLVLAWGTPQWAPGDAATAIGTMTPGAILNADGAIPAMVIGVGGASLTLTVLYFAANQLMTNFQALRMPGARTLQ